MAASFRWGIIAPGRIAERFANDVALVEGAELAAVASSNRSRGKAFAKRHAIPHCFQSYQVMLEQSELDAVYIANPHAFHFETVKLCLEAGVAVLCEKPLTVNAQQTQRLIELAERQQVFLMEALWSRCLPAWHQARTWLDQGRIGELKLMQSNFCFKAPRDESDRLLNPELAGGALLDVGVYNIAMSQFICRRSPESIQAQAELGPTGVDELSSVCLSYGKAKSQFSCSLQIASHNNFVLYGTEGCIEIPALFCAATEARLNSQDAATELFSQLFAGSGFEYQIIEVMQRVRAGELESEHNRWADSLALMQICDEIRQQIGLRYPFED